MTNRGVDVAVISSEKWRMTHVGISGGARGGMGELSPFQKGLSPPPESFETRIEIRKSYVMSDFLGAEPP
jgi:hypothetical protein